MMAWDLGGNWTTEMQRLRLSAKLPVARIDEFLPPYQGERAPVVRDYAALYRELGLNQGAVRQAWLQLPEIAPPSGVEGVGSNNWVLAGSRTTTGRPLLANDPHLGLNTPALWYFARLQAPGLDVAGATMPGLPGVVLGQNARLAWGFTNTGPDVQDLYIEEIVPTSPPRYRTPEGTAAFERFEEIIRVRGGPEVKLAVRRTRHGPVISDAGTLDDALGARHVLAMRWTALDADSDVMATSLAMMRATSVPAFVQAPRQGVALPGVSVWVDALAADRVPAPHAAGPDDLASILYTSGTTGRPKGCIHSHRTMMTTIVGGALWVHECQESVLLATAPMFHVTGMQHSMGTALYVGATIVFLPRWDAGAAAYLIEKYRCTHWANVPTMPAGPPGQAAGQQGSRAADQGSALG
jgi:penicillin amidase